MSRFGFGFGFGVRPPGWFSDEEGREVEEAEEETELPDIVQDEESWRELNRSETEKDLQSSVREARHRQHEPYSDVSSSDSSEDSSHRYRRHKRSRRSHNKRRRDESRELEVDPPRPVAVDAFRGWTMPEFNEKGSFEELRQEWPTWKNMLLGMLRMKERGCQLSEEDKVTLLLTRGGKTIRDIHAYQPVVEGEVAGTEVELEPQLTNLLKRCDFYFKARDPTTEMTVLRGMQQLKDEPVRDFLAKARKQIRLCGYRTLEEQDRELVMLLKTNSIDSNEISKQSMGRSAAELEALAVSLEELRRRGSMATTTRPEPVKEGKDEEDVVHAIARGHNRVDNFSRTQSFTAGNGRGWSRGGTSRRGQGGYNSNWSRAERWDRSGNGSGTRQKRKCFDCGSETHQRENCPRGPCCYTCGDSSHFSAACPQNAQRQEGRRGTSRVSQVEAGQREKASDEKVKNDGWDY